VLATNARVSSSNPRPGVLEDEKQQFFPHRGNYRMSGKTIYTFYMNIFCADDNETRTKRTRTTSKEKFHEQLKASVVLNQVAKPDDAEPTTLEQLVRQSTEFEEAISSNKQTEIYFKCLIGRNIKAIKDRKGTKKWAAYVKQHIKYSRSMSYFLMELHELTLTYNRLMYVSIGIGVLKTKFKMVKEIIQLEPAFWKSTN
jgi:hypothetical protein